MLKDQIDFPIIGIFNVIIRKFADKFDERRTKNEEGYYPLCPLC